METKSSKEKEIEDKIKVAELMGEAELLEEEQISETEARKSKKNWLKLKLDFQHTTIYLLMMSRSSRRVHSIDGTIKGRKFLVQEIRSISRQKFTTKTNYAMHRTKLMKGSKRKKTNSTRRQVARSC